MLLDLKLLSASKTSLLSWGKTICLAAVALGTVGARPSGIDWAGATVSAQGKSRAAVAGETAAALNPLYVPADAFVVIAARPGSLNEIAKTVLPAGAPNPLEAIAGCEHASLVLYPPSKTQPGPPGNGFCLTFATREAREAAQLKISPPAGVTWQKNQVGKTEYEVSSPGEQARYLPDEKTLIMGNKEVVEKMIACGTKSLSPLTQTASWKAAANGTLAIAIDAAELKKVMAQAPPNPAVGMFSPMWDTATSHTLGLALGDKMQLSLATESKDAAGAQKIEGLQRMGMTMLSNILSQAKNSPDERMKKILESLTPILDGHKIATKGNQTTLSLEGDLKGLVASLAVPVAEARTAAMRSQQKNNMKQIMLAMHNYHDVYGHFPPAIVIDPLSKAERSWRVELLPFVEGAQQYNDYKKDEAWDSEANLKILAQMPSVFRHPSQSAESTNTAVVAAYGEGLLFGEDDTDGTPISEITDGTSNTIAVLEADTEIPWSKPEDLAIDLAQDELPLPEFGFQPEGYNVGFCDGSVRFISKTLDVGTLKKLFTMAGGESVGEF